MTYDEMKKILCAAGIRTTEAARLFRVDRQTLYNWDKKAPVSSNFAFAIGVCNRVRQETEIGELPLKSSCKDRWATLYRIIFP